MLMIILSVLAYIAVGVFPAHWYHWNVLYPCERGELAMGMCVLLWPVIAALLIIRGVGWLVFKAFREVD